MHVIIYLSKPTGCAAPMVYCNVNYELRVIMIHRFIGGNKSTSVVSGADNGGGSACVGAGGIVNSLHLSILL